MEAGEQLAFKVDQPEQGEPANGSPLRIRGDGNVQPPDQWLATRALLDTLLQQENADEAAAPVDF
jgi:hypothetical protein